jgi:NAD(P)-dependent dehydrogenase (short-subunit alcohol dehydrogenase family)
MLDRMATSEVVLITGATRGIGLATAALLATRGMRVYGTHRASSDTRALDAAIAAGDGRLHRRVVDVTSAESVRDGVEAIERTEGAIDVLIHNACDVVIGTVETCSLAQQMHSMDVNYFGAVRLLQEVLPGMRARRRGRIIHMSSVAGIDPYPPIETYAATKFALEGLTESLATTLSPWGIFVSLIEPGGVRTEAPALAPQGERALAPNPYARYCAAAQQRMIESYAAGAAQEPKAIAELVAQVIAAERPHLRYPSGAFAEDIARRRFSDPTGDAPVAAKRALLEQAGLLQLIQE